jgi:hypothetical protein
MTELPAVLVKRGMVRYLTPTHFPSFPGDSGKITL